MDPLITAALIAAAATVFQALLSIRNGKRTKEIHKQVSENSHKNEKPTVLDLIAEVRDEQRATNKLVVQHIAWHLNGDKK